MRDERHYRKMLEQNSSASVGFTLAASAVYAARYGFCEPAQHGTDEWSTIARRLKSGYGENLSVDEVAAEMDKAHRSAAASELGSMTSERKAKSSRENGKRGGRHVKHFEVIFDNGGGTTLQVGKRGFAHHYDRGEDAARDVKVLLDGGNTRDWEGNEPDGRMSYDYDAERNGGYRWHSVDDIRAVIAKGTLEPNDSGHGWNNAEGFYAALGVTVIE